MLEFIIPAYDQSEHLEECICSLLNQSTICPISIATSTPSLFLEELSKKYQIPIKLNPNKQSISDDWNFALASGTHPLRVLAHQDDIYDKKFAEKALQFYQSNPEIGILFTDIKEVNADRSIEVKREFVKKILRKSAFLNSSVINHEFSYFLLLGFGCPIPCPSVIFNWSKVADINFSSLYTVNLDWDYWCKVADAKIKIGYLPENLMTHRIHINAETQIALIEHRRHDEDKQIFSRFWPPFIVYLLHYFYKMGY